MEISHSRLANITVTDQLQLQISFKTITNTNNAEERLKHRISHCATYKQQRCQATCCQVPIADCRK